MCVNVCVHVVFRSLRIMCYVSVFYVYKSIPIQAFYNTTFWTKKNKKLKLSLDFLRSFLKRLFFFFLPFTFNFNVTLLKSKNYPYSSSSVTLSTDNITHSTNNTSSHYTHTHAQSHTCTGSLENI